MEEVIIITRDINGKRIYHCMSWDEVCDYIDSHKVYEAEEEILLVIVEETCIYSYLASPSITWEDVLGFFA